MKYFHLRGVVANVVVCGIVVSEFELQSRYNIKFRFNTIAKRMNPSNALFMSWIELPLFDNDGLGIK